MNDEIDDIERIVQQLEAEVPWETVSKVLDHQGWRDLVETIKATCPPAFAAMCWTYGHNYVAEEHRHAHQ